MVFIFKITKVEFDILKSRCNCPDHEEIPWKEWYIQKGIPKYIKGHGRKGKVCTKEHKNKISKSNKGKKLTEEHKTKIGKANSISLKGNIPWIKGKHHTEESKQKLSKSHIGKVSPAKGRHHPPYKGSGFGKGSYCISPLQGIIYLKSSYELAYSKWLDENKILWEYEPNTFELGHTSYTPDFYIVEQDEYIEVKGYMFPQQQEKINRTIQTYNIKLKILYKNDLLELGCKLV